jgi:methylmalonyl-CoA mutase
MNDEDRSETSPRASREAWLKRVEGVLKGAGFAERLVSETADGIALQPLYEERMGPRAWRGTAGPWIVTQRLDLPDAASANEQALDDLNNGATGLALVFQGAAAGHGFGLADHDQRSIARALADVRLDCIALRLEPGPHGRRTAEAIAAHVDTLPLDPERLDLQFGMDPVGALASRGDLAAPWPEIAGRMRTTVDSLRGRNFTGPFMMADGRVWHDAGASEAHELGLTLSAVVAYLRALDALPSDDLARAVAITLSADQDMFLTLAKFRAVRLLHARILELSHLPSTPLHLHAETSWRMMAAKDPHTNILRSTAAVFGAGLGGADSIAVLPFSIAQGLPDRFARRVARNSQNILLSESNLWRVADPAAGAGYVESLTSELCDKAWNEFQAIEKAGGIVEALRAGLVQSRLTDARQRAAESKPIIGVTAFAPPVEPAPAILSTQAVTPRPRIGAAILIDPVPSLRRAEAFEGKTEMGATA